MEYFKAGRFHYIGVTLERGAVSATTTKNETTQIFTCFLLVLIMLLLHSSFTFNIYCICDCGFSETRKPECELISLPAAQPHKTERAFSYS